ncbi:hypothetical protein [Gracilimonas tropica]|uniref:hypothetical protein n=1 Tax=Gracilimonas tropica TaxID=454600 RepID=UPI00036F6AB5|nr:hypothetical protein [Gracilimonas tropica]
MSKKALYNDEASRLYIYEGYQLSQLEEYFKGRVSGRTLWAWKEEGEWDRKRDKHEKNQTDIRGMVVELARLTLKEAIADPADSQKVYAAMAAIGRIGQKNFLEIVSGLDGNNEEKEEKKDFKELFELLQKQLKG